ncbi:hypothetical protein [Flagellimonas flava]|uniref:hypothetical protein n=1 Tax=Flagellimonas flava TaxID=570519 RepID=UPI003D660AB6
MPTTPILQTIQNFVHHSPYNCMEINFADHLVLNSQNQLPFLPVLKQHSRIMLCKKSPKGLVQMLVADNPVFNFSFDFVLPAEQEFYLGTMLQLPSPLDQGHLHMDADQLTLSYRINAKDPKLRFYVSQTFTHVHHVEKFPSGHLV